MQQRRFDPLLLRQLDPIESGFTLAKDYRAYPELLEDHDVISRMQQLKQLKQQQVLDVLSKMEKNIAIEIDNLHSPQNMSSTPMFASRTSSAQAFTALNNLKDAVKLQRQQITELDIDSSDFNLQLDSAVTKLYRETKQYSHDPAIKKSPSTDGLFGWIKNALRKLGVTSSNAEQLTRSANAALEAVMQDKSNVFTKAEHKQVKEILEIDAALEYRESLENKGYKGNEDALELLGAPSTGETASMRERKVALLDGNDKTNTLYDLVKAGKEAQNKLSQRSKL